MAYADERLGERACAVVVPKPGQTLDLAGMVEFLKSQKVALQYIPERLIVRDAMPATPSGKIQKFKLREMLQGGCEAMTAASAGRSRSPLVTGAGGPMGAADRAEPGAHEGAPGGFDRHLGQPPRRHCHDSAAASKRAAVRNASWRCAPTPRTATKGPAVVETRTGALRAHRHPGQCGRGHPRRQARTHPSSRLAEAQWDSTLALNLKPGFHLIQEVAPGMLERGSGRIVNVSSVVYAGEGGQARLLPPPRPRWRR